MCTYSVFDSFHVFDVLNKAYRLQFCLPPPIIPNAEILMASKEFKIGRWDTLSQKDTIHLWTHTITAIEALLTFLLTLLTLVPS